MAKKELPPPPAAPDLQAAYDELQRLYAASQARCAELENQGPKELEPLRLEIARLKDAAQAAKDTAERSKAAAARAQQELAAARTPAAGIDPKARTFRYVKGDPKNPASPREHVRALTQALADAQIPQLLADGYVFRGCV